MKKSIFVSTLVAATAMAVPAFADDLTWGGSSENWTAEGAWSGSDWVDNSDAIFGSTSGTTTVTVTGEVTAGSVTINSGASYTFNIDSSATLTTGTLTNSGSLALTGSGTVKTGYSSDVAFVIDATSFTGTLEITSGRFDLVNSTVNASATLVFDTTGSSSDYYGDGTVSIHYGTTKGTQEVPVSYTLANNVELKGDGGVILRTGNPYTTITFTGSVTGESAELQLNGGGNAIFQGSVDLGTYITYQGSTTFAGETTLGTLEFSNDGGSTNASSVTFSTDASVGAITVDTTRASAFTDQLTVDSGATLTVGSISLGKDSLEVTASAGTLVVTGDITVDGGKLSIGSGSTVTATGATADGVAALQGIAGSGTLELKSSATGTQFTVVTDDSFAGTVNLVEGQLLMSGSSIAEGASLVLQASGEQTSIGIYTDGNESNTLASIHYGENGATLAHDITLEGTGGVIIRSYNSEWTGTFSGNISGTDASYLQLNGGGSVTISGTVTLENGGYINYQGSTTFTNAVKLGSLAIYQPSGATNAVTFTGSTAVAEIGTLTLHSSEGTVTPTLTVEKGASLTVDALVIDHNVAIAIDNATMSITSSVSGNNSASITISNGGTLSVGQGVTLNNATINIVLGEGDVASTNGISLTAADSAILTGSGTITSNAAIAITVDSALANLLSESTEGTTYTFDIYDSNLTISGTFDLSAFDQYGTASIDSGVLSVTVGAVPEPSMFGIFAGLGAIGLVATRRRRRA